MQDELWRRWRSLEKQELRFCAAPLRQPLWKTKLQERVPAGLRAALQKAFAGAFGLVFVNGTGILEKTFDKESRQMDFAADDHVFCQRPGKKSLQRLERAAKKSGFANSAATTVAGLGLGFAGLGLPDIPLLVGTLLKGIYETALSYGFSYHNPAEQVYILRLLSAAFCPADQRTARLVALRAVGDFLTVPKEELDATAAVLADALLVEKFIQGIPLVGAAGAAVNHTAYRRTVALARLCYEKRYLKEKLTDPRHPADCTGL